MNNALVSNRIQGTLASLTPLLSLQMDPAFAALAEDPETSNFTFGNPNEMPLPGYVQSLQRSLVPQNKDWFAYKMDVRSAQQTVAASLRERRGEPFEPDDIAMTTGAFAGLAVCLATITNPGDEVIYSKPPWFFYESLILTYSATPVAVNVRPDTFDLDLDAIEAALTPRTRAILVNSPNNPTGRIYPPDTLRRLAQLLTAASARYGHPIYILSDEAYHRLVFDNRQFYSPASYYPNTFVIYTYGKTLLTPGQRVGYIALPPTMPHRQEIRMALTGAQAVTGYAFPNAVLQYALPELEKLSIDVAALQRRRDTLVDALYNQGYTLQSPEATFYLLVRSPMEDDTAFVRLLMEHKVLCLPGSVFSMPGYFRISLTANDAMIERAIPIFAQVFLQLGQAEPIFT
jgi:aspartate aminotransferase